MEIRRVVGGPNRRRDGYGQSVPPPIDRSCAVGSSALPRPVRLLTNPLEHIFDSTGGHRQKPGPATGFGARPDRPRVARNLPAVIRANRPGGAWEPGFRAAYRAVMTGMDRPRRLRRTPAMRRLVAETTLEPRQLVLPMFVADGLAEPREISSMP